MSYTILKSWPHVPGSWQPANQIIYHTLAEAKSAMAVLQRDFLYRRFTIREEEHNGNNYN